MARRGKSIDYDVTNVLSKIDLHIVSFNVPLPANYGGVIDVFYKLDALTKMGCKVALHCFDYGRGEVKELKKHAAEVFYYTRKVSAWNAIVLSPFSVKSRSSEQLLKRLSADEAPILFESLQCCLYLDHPELAHKRKWVRAHNVEHNYYNSLAQYESSGLRKSYYALEANALRKYEKVLHHADGVLAISPKDQAYFEKLGHVSKYLPAFYRKEVQDNFAKEEKSIALYQGNLKVEENVEAVLFLLEVFQDSPYSLIVAGSQPGKDIQERVAKMSNVTLLANPSDQEMFDLIRTSKVNCLPSFQSTGIKLKLLHALTSGNQVLVNPTMVEGTGLEKYCSVADEIEDWRRQLELLFSAETEMQKIQTRQELVSGLFDNQKNATQLAEWLELAL